MHEQLNVLPKCGPLLNLLVGHVCIICSKCPTELRKQCQAERRQPECEVSSRNFIKAAKEAGVLTSEEISMF